MQIYELFCIFVGKNRIQAFPDGRNIFIYKKDTMSITLSLEKRKQILIQNLHFQKGEYTINLKDCNFQSDYYIKNFPSDCLNYRREEE